MEMVKKRLGDILIDCNLIGEDQLKQALGYQRERGFKLGEALISLELVTEDDIIWALGNQLNISFIHLNPQIIEPAVLKLVSPEYAKDHYIMPLYKSGNQLSICMVDPLDVDTIEYIASTTRFDISVSICTKFDFEQTFAAVYGPIEIQEKSVESELTPDKTSLDRGIPKGMEGPEKVINYVLGQAIVNRVSKIHFEPAEKGVQIRFRTCSGLVKKLDTPVKIHQEIIAKLKTLSQIQIPQGPSVAVQSGHFRVAVTGKSISVQGLFYPTVNGEMVILKLTHSGDSARETIGKETALLENVGEFLRQNQGVLFVSGPHESGRTLSSYFLLNSFDLERNKAITVENPILSNLSHVTQIQMGTNGVHSFSEAFKLALNLDGDIIFVDSPDDTSIFNDICYSGLGGKTLITTVVAHDAASTILHAKGCVSDPLVLANSSSGFLSQRLIRILCAECRKPFTPSEAQMEMLKEESGNFFQPHGCDTCLHTGYSGKRLVVEFVPISAPLRQMIINNQSYQEIYHFLRKQDIPSFHESVSKMVCAGDSSFDELNRLY